MMESPRKDQSHAIGTAVILIGFKYLQPSNSPLLYHGNHSNHAVCSDHSSGQDQYGGSSSHGSPGNDSNHIPSDQDMQLVTYEEFLVIQNNEGKQRILVIM